jgi:hypothetical protein
MQKNSERLRRILQYSKMGIPIPKDTFEGLLKENDELIQELKKLPSERLIVK